MTKRRTMRGFLLDDLLQTALASQAPVTVRAIGACHVIQGLKICGLEDGLSISLDVGTGPMPFLTLGASVAISFILEDQVVSARAVVQKAPLSGSPLLVVAWPSPFLEFHTLREVRVTVSGEPPLIALLEMGGRSQVAEVLNLTEHGLGLGLQEPVSLGLNLRLTVDVELPGGSLIHAQGCVRHFERLDGDRLPMRIGLLFEGLPDFCREALHQFMQEYRGQELVAAQECSC